MRKLVFAVATVFLVSACGHWSSAKPLPANWSPEVSRGPATQTITKPCPKGTKLVEKNDKLVCDKIKKNKNKKHKKKADAPAPAAK